MKRNLFFVLLCAAWVGIGSVSGWTLWVRIAAVISALALLLCVFRDWSGRHGE
ncbi:hypothetical protein [Yanshouia hominis]|uniref:Uncharacterized protein n=1 Tax=Yanshouia hominis TaxID=2763673 RepID=A0ABR7NHQ6_9FIRM|nr:hypothetical protein [Yanshouia hominis]MBC8575834.1 hypothetical protein [Yanshouia hominis]